MAIAFDAGTDGGSGGSPSLTFAHTCTGTNRYLFVAVMTNDSTDTVSGVTYAGTAMTRINFLSSSGARGEYFYYLAAPASGANNVVISSSSGTIGGIAVSYTGCTTGAIEANSSQNTQAATITTTLTTIGDNSWTVMMSGANGQSTTASTGSTLRVTGTGFNDFKVFDSNAPITPAGSTSMLVTTANTANVVTIMASVSIFVVSTGSKGFFALMNR